MFTVCTRAWSSMDGEGKVRNSNKADHLHALLSVQGQSRLILYKLFESRLRQLLFFSWEKGVVFGLNSCFDLPCLADWDFMATQWRVWQVWELVFLVSTLVTTTGASLTVSTHIAGSV